MSNKNDRWSALSMSDRADLIRLYVAQGITDLKQMHKHYNGIPYRDFNTSEYDYFGASPDMEPKEEGQHWGSRNLYTAQLLKREDHPTRDLMLEGEKQAGYNVVKSWDGLEYSIPKEVNNYVEDYNSFGDGGDILHYDDTYIEPSIVTATRESSLADKIFNYELSKAIFEENKKDSKQDKNTLKEDNKPKSVLGIDRFIHNPIIKEDISRLYSNLDTNKIRINNIFSGEEDQDNTVYYYYDTPIEASVVKAFNSQEDYNRYYGEQFGKKVAEGMNNAAPFVLDAAMLPFTISGAIEAPMLLYQGVKAAPQLIRGAKTLLTKGKKAIGKKVLGMVDDMNGYVKEGSHFRIVDKPAIDDAISSGTIRSKTGLYHGVPEYLRKNFSKYLDDIPGWESMDANELKELLDAKGAFNGMTEAEKKIAKFKIGNSTNHGGTVGYFKDTPYPNYNISNSNYVIETPESIGSFVAGHGGEEFVDIPLEHAGATLLKTNGSVKGASIPSKGSSYWEYSPFFEMWKKKKFATGGPTENNWEIPFSLEPTTVPITKYDYYTLAPEAVQIPIRDIKQKYAMAPELIALDETSQIAELKERAAKEYSFGVLPNVLNDIGNQERVNKTMLTNIYHNNQPDDFKYINSSEVDTSPKIKITAPNTDISKFICGNNISEEAIKEIKQVASKRGLDPYDILAHMLIESSGEFNGITRNSYFNTHDVLERQISPRLLDSNNSRNIETLLRNLGVYNESRQYTNEEIRDYILDYGKQLQEAISNLEYPSSTIDAVGLRISKFGKDFNPAQKGFKSNKGEVKNSYLDMIDSAITSLKENMPDLFK